MSKSKPSTLSMQEMREQEDTFQCLSQLITQTSQ